MAEREFNTTRTGTRKFFGKDQVENPTGSATANAAHISRSASGLSSVSEVTARLAAAARERVRLVRSALADVPVTAREDVRETDRPGDPEMHDTTTVEGVTALVGPSVVASARELVTGAARSVLPSSGGGGPRSTTNGSTPTLVRVSVDLDKKKGSVDCFFARVTFALPTVAVTPVPGKGREVVAVRVFRSTSPVSALGSGQGRLSLHGVDRLRTDRNRSRQKNQDPVSPVEQRLREAAVDNALTALIPVDRFLNVRTGARASGSSLTAVPPVSNSSVGADVGEADVASYLSSGDFSRLDRSVIRDLKTLRNIQVQSPASVASVGSSAVVVGRDPTGTGSPLVVDPANGQGFVEVAFLSPDKLSGRTTGELTEYTFEDQSVSYGRSYRYYVVSVDRNMAESTRSRIVEVRVDGMRVPERPRRVTAQVVRGFVSMTMQVDDQLVEKFEVYRKEEDPDVSDDDVEYRTVLPESGFVTGARTSTRLPNLLLPVGEVLNAHGAGGGTFRDVRVLPGRRYTYRVYSVDIFGNKSESPYEVDVFVPDPAHRPLDLRKPTVVAEVDSTTNKARVTFAADDPKVVALMLSRRDLTIGQRAFSTPGDVNCVRLGRPDVRGARRFEDVRSFDGSKDVAWGGLFQNTGGQVVFVDQTVSLDHTYQYRVVGVDRFGNRTPAAISGHVFVTRRPLVSHPLNVRATIVTGSDRAVAGVSLTWDDGNVDVTSEDRVGNRDALSSSIVRTLFQVERRRVGEERWLEFPMVEGRSLLDPAESAGESPPYRPPYVRMNERYVYRVQAYQTGNFISNLSAPVDVLVRPPVLTPAAFTVRPSDTRVGPFFVMLNWSTDPSSGAVDRWEVQRAEVNNLAAARVGTRGAAGIAALPFHPFRTVYRESSRFRSAAQDRVLPPRGSPTVTGEHHFMDTSVAFGNTYYYRIRALGTDGAASPWAYRGVRVTDQSFEHKFSTLVGDAERSALAASTSPAVVRDVHDPGGRRSTYGLTSTFAEPVVEQLRPPPGDSDVTAQAGNPSALPVLLSLRTLRFT